MRKSRKILSACLGLPVLDITLVLCLVSVPYPGSNANAAESIDHGKQPPKAKISEKNGSDKPGYQSLLPQTEVVDLKEEPGERRHGFDDEDRSFSEGMKVRNFSSMEELAKAIPDYVDIPNAVRDLLTTARLSVRMQRNAQGWRPVRIDGEPYLRAIFAESWIYLSKQSEFRRILENIDYPSVRFEVNLSVQSSLAIDEKPRSRIQGNFIALEMALKRSTSKEWMLLSAWQQANGGALVGLNVVGLALYVYDAYKNRNREDPILLRLQQSPAYKAPVRER